jgi:hypothetical protein
MLRITGMCRQRFYCRWWLSGLLKGLDRPKNIEILYSLGGFYGGLDPAGNIGSAFKSALVVN